MKGQEKSPNCMALSQTVFDTHHKNFKWEPIRPPPPPTVIGLIGTCEDCCQWVVTVMSASLPFYCANGYCVTASNTVWKWQACVARIFGLDYHGTRDFVSDIGTDVISPRSLEKVRKLRNTCPADGADSVPISAPVNGRIRNVRIGKTVWGYLVQIWWPQVNIF